MTVSDIAIDKLCIWAAMENGHAKDDVLLDLVGEYDYGNVAPDEVQEAYDTYGIRGVEELFV